MTQLFDRAIVLRAHDVEIRDLRVAFSVERTLRPTPNRAEIHVYNMSEEHRRALSALGSVAVRLEVGYQEDTHLVFAGELRNVTSTYKAPDWDTKLDGVDGQTALRSARIRRSYRPGTTVAKVLGDLADAMGLGRGNVDELAAQAQLTGGAGTQFIDGTILHGPAADALDRICRSCGIEYSVQNGTLQLLPLGDALAGSALVLSSDSGLVEDVAREKQNTIRFKTLMLPDLFPGRLVRPQTRTISGGDYRVTRCTYRGDTHGQEWYIECQAESLAALSVAQQRRARQIREQVERVVGTTIAAGVANQIAGG